MKVHFSGEPDTFRRVRALFPAACTLRQKPEWAMPVDRKFRLTRLQAMADRILGKQKGRAA